MDGNLQKLNRKVDELDFKVTLSHKSIEEKVMANVHKLIEERLPMRRSTTSSYSR